VLLSFLLPETISLKRKGLSGLTVLEVPVHDLLVTSLGTCGQEAQMWWHKTALLITSQEAREKRQELYNPPQGPVTNN
jgi:hypothetical protein